MKVAISGQIRIGSYSTGSEAYLCCAALKCYEHRRAAMYTCQITGQLLASNTQTCYLQYQAVFKLLLGSSKKTHVNGPPLPYSTALTRAEHLGQIQKATRQHTTVLTTVSRRKRSKACNHGTI